MKILATILALVATVTAQNYNPVLPLAEQPQYASVHPLTPFNVAPDGFYGYNPYTNELGLPQQAPAYNNYAPLPYQYPVIYPHPAYPNPAYPQFPVVPQFPQFPQLFPQQQQQLHLPNLFQPTLHPAFPPQVIQYGSPQPNPAAVSYTNYQTHTTSPSQQTPKPAVAQAQGVNGLTKPVTTAAGNGNQAYGSAFGQYVAVPAASSPKQAARYEAVSGSTVHTADLPGHDMDYKVVSGQPAAPTTDKTSTVSGMQ